MTWFVLPLVSDWEAHWISHMFVSTLVMMMTKMPSRVWPAGGVRGGTLYTIRLMISFANQLFSKGPLLIRASGLLISDGKTPYKLFIIRWTCGRLVIGDATCNDTCSVQHSCGNDRSTSSVGPRTNELSLMKSRTDSSYIFVPMDVETCGSFRT